MVSDPSKGDGLERETLAKLRQFLTQDELKAIPSLIAERRASILRKIDSDRQRRDEETRERIRQEQIRKQAEERRTTMLHEIRQRFNCDFLSTTSFYFETCADILTEQEFEAEKFSFVKHWLKVNGPKQLPDDEQIAAISSVHGHIQVVARAGSGKTTTLVSRVLFLLKHCRIAPAEILILAFNRKAALEVRRRLLVLIDQNAELKIATEINRRIKDSR